MKATYTCIVIFIILPIFSTAQLQFAKIFSDNMILQRDKVINIWGKASPKYAVTISFGGETKTVIVHKDSNWIASFKSQKANLHPQSIYVRSGMQKDSIKNILIGDLWLCIGQSNMEWPMSKELHFASEKTNAENPLIRLFNPTYAGKNTFNVSFTDSIVTNLTVDHFYKGSWQRCDSVSFKSMSAVAYYFGKEIATTIQIPIGLIHIAIGGAPLESFISKEAFLNSKQFSKKVNSDWMMNSFLPVWVRERGMQNVGKNKNVPKDDQGNNHAFKPGFAYEAGIKPLLNMPIKGILCYQGESNAQEIERVDEYGQLSLLMMNDLRKKWHQPDLPFLFTQLSSIDTLHYKGQLWPNFRDEQRKMLDLIPFSGMAVTSDIGFKNDVHPTNKKLVGERLAAWALCKTYFKKNIPSGPLPISAVFKDGKIKINFKYANNGLTTSDQKQLSGFSINAITEVPAIIDENKIVIYTTAKPAFVYYGWTPYTNANLTNKNLLPTSTFKIKVK